MRLARAVLTDEGAPSGVEGGRHFGELQEFAGLPVDSLEDIAVGKLLALFGRADPKDFVDLYFLLAVEKRFDFGCAAADIEEQP